MAKNCKETDESQVDEFGDPLPQFRYAKWKCYLVRDSHTSLVVYLLNEGYRIGHPEKLSIYLNADCSGHARKSIGNFVADYCNRYHADPEIFQWKQLQELRTMAGDMYKHKVWW